MSFPLAALLTALVLWSVGLGWLALAFVVAAGTGALLRRSRRRYPPVVVEQRTHVRLLPFDQERGT